jgi:hypothetical protein
MDDDVGHTGLVTTWPLLGTRLTTRVRNSSACRVSAPAVGPLALSDPSLTVPVSGE